MPTSYTSLLGLALPVTGELSGTWGDTVNDYITQYLDAAVAGAQTISGSQTAVTLSKTTASSLTQAGSGSTGSSQYQIINCTGNPAGLLTITVPAASKAYLVLNSTSTSQSVKVVGAGPTTGVTMVSGEKALIAWDGSDFVKVASSTADGVTTLSFGTTGLTPNSATAGAITVAGTLVAANGGTGQSSYTTGDLLYATGSTALSKLGIGTNGQILTSTGTAPQWSTLSGVAVTTFSAGTTGFTPSTATSGAVTLAGTLATTNGGTGLTSFTANRVFYSSSTSAIGSSANLTFDGTTLTANALTTTSTVTINGGTANGVAYLNGSKVLTTGSALTFDGTKLTNTGSAGGVKLEIVSTASSPEISLTSADTGLSQINFGGVTTPKKGVFRYSDNSDLFIWFLNSTAEQMRLTSTGLGIGTSSPTDKLTVSGGGNGSARVNGSDNVFLKLSGAAANEKHVDFYHDNTLAFENYLDGSNNFIWRTRVGGLTERMRIDSSGNLGLGVTPSAWGTSEYKAIQIGNGASVYGRVQSGDQDKAGLSSNAYSNGTNWLYIATDSAANYTQIGGGHYWYTAASGTAGNTISFTQAMDLANSSGASTLTVNSAINTASAVRLTTNGGLTAGMFLAAPAADHSLGFQTAGSERARITSGGQIAASSAGTAAAPVITKSDDLDTGIFFPAANELAFAVNGVEELRITSAGFTRPVAYADTVSALGNSGTATTINLLNANVFTATLTGNCTFTLSNPIATGSSSFTLILTNDGTAGRTVAWAGGSFVFPGGAAALSRTTTANAVDVWVFFTPNGGTTWYGNIAMKDMKA